jgi:hypothetical protein
MTAPFTKPTNGIINICGKAKKIRPIELKFINSNNMEYTYLIDDDELQGLNCLIGKQVNTIFGNGLSVHENYIETQAFEINAASNLWLNFSSEAKETPENNDYYKFIIKSNNIPLDIPFDNNINSLIYPFSKVSLKPAVVNSIEVYSRNETYGKEELNYDVLLLFNCDRKNHFMIALEERVDEFLVYSSNSKIIKRYLTGLNHRIKLR